MRKSVIVAMTLLGSAMFYSCSDKSEQVAAGEEADQIELKSSADEIANAAIEGRNAAKEIVRKNWSDSVEIQRAVLEVRARNSRYDMEGKSKCKAAFDSAFFSTIRTVRPDLAKALDAKSE